MLRLLWHHRFTLHIYSHLYTHLSAFQSCFTYLHNSVSVHLSSWRRLSILFVYSFSVNLHITRIFCLVSSFSRCVRVCFSLAVTIQSTHASPSPECVSVPLCFSDFLFAYQSSMYLVPSFLPPSFPPFPSLPLWICSSFLLVCLSLRLSVFLLVNIYVRLHSVRLSRCLSFTVMFVSVYMSFFSASLVYLSFLCRSSVSLFTPFDIFSMSVFTCLHFTCLFFFFVETFNILSIYISVFPFVCLRITPACPFFIPSFFLPCNYLSLLFSIPSVQFCLFNPVCLSYVPFISAVSSFIPV